MRRLSGPQVQFSYPARMQAALSACLFHELMLISCKWQREPQQAWLSAVGVPRQNSSKWLLVYALGVGALIIGW